ncbi:MAG TPA: C1 family peptidase [Polyangia bacterium]|jgi:hypothetical protein|nr:C1 family peptidase [Polyangia bacterium]
MAFRTYGELRQDLVRQGIQWKVNPKFADSLPVHRPALGADLTQHPRAATVPHTDVTALVRAAPTTNSLLRKYLIERHILPPTSWIAAQPFPLPAGGAGGHASQVDWRNRFGWSWITQTRDQSPCQHCWIYAATALIEAMVRIEHCVWCVRSEGDYIVANGVPCGGRGGAAAVLDWVKDNGLADPDCGPWANDDPAHRSGPYYDPPSGPIQPPPVLAIPFSRRGGRTVKIPAYRSIGDPSEQKKWIDTIGPLVVAFDCYSDFPGWSGTVPYRRSANAVGLGGHFMLAVGYDDHLNCWIVKNSWGTSFGNDGFCLIAYGECSIDAHAKLGLQFTDPDPWTKRRCHSGGLIESSDGALHRNFELVAPSRGNSLTHWRRDNADPSFPWSKGNTWGDDVAEPPTLTSTTYNRNFEAIYRTTGSRLRHCYFDQRSRQWGPTDVFGPTHATGAVGFVETNWGPGNFEVVVAVGGGQLQHWWRNNVGQWSAGDTFGSGVATMGPSLIQSTWGNLELVCVLSNGQMRHFWRDDEHGRQTWSAGDQFGSGISSPPCMIEGQYGMANEHGHGNFELCVAAPDGTIQHWRRDNQQGTLPWSLKTTFGRNVARVVALMEGSFGFNLELIALRNDGELQHYWRDGDGWHEGQVIGTTR